MKKIVGMLMLITLLVTLSSCANYNAINKADKLIDQDITFVHTNGITIGEEDYSYDDLVYKKLHSKGITTEKNTNEPRDIYLSLDYYTAYYMDNTVYYLKEYYNMISEEDINSIFHRYVFVKIDIETLEVEILKYFYYRNNRILDFYFNNNVFTFVISYKNDLHCYEYYEINSEYNEEDVYFYDSDKENFISEYLGYNVYEVAINDDKYIINLKQIRNQVDCVEEIEDSVRGDDHKFNISDVFHLDNSIYVRLSYHRDYIFLRPFYWEFDFRSDIFFPNLIIKYDYEKDYYTLVGYLDYGTGYIIKIIE